MNIQVVTCGLYTDKYKENYIWNYYVQDKTEHVKTQFIIYTHSQFLSHLQTQWGTLSFHDDSANDEMRRKMESHKMRKYTWYETEEEKNQK